MAGRMGSSLIALCSAAVGAIYVTGYVVTDTAPSAGAGSTAAMTAPGSNAAAPGAGKSTSGSPSGSAGNKTQPSAGGAPSSGNAKSAAGGKPSGSTSGKSPSSQQQYLDGTYHGSGSDQIGTVSVAVKIAGGKIANVQITQCLTHYPQSYIDPVLPQEVVARQSYKVSIISGATLSTYDFAYAVYNALNQAKNPHYKA